MHLIVCVKRVPATDTKIKVGADGRSIDAAGVEFVLNPYDEFAVEEALRIKERAGTGEVAILSLGPSEAQKEIRTCLAMGADKGILLKDEKVYARDAFAISSMLASQIQKMPHDLVLFGKQAVDQDNSQVGQRIAALLGIPCVCEVVKISLEGGKALVEREAEGGHEVVETPLPAVLTAQKGLNEPRYASLKGIMAAKKKTIEEIVLAEVEPKMRVVELTLPPPRPPGRILGQGPEAVPELVRVLREEAKVL